jgi:hypothetical protein
MTPFVHFAYQIFTARHFISKLLALLHSKHHNMIIRSFSLRGAIVRVQAYIHFGYTARQNCTINIVMHTDVPAYVISSVIPYDWIIGPDQWGYINLGELLHAYSEGGEYGRGFWQGMKQCGDTENDL